jgi:hypothetical protein
VRRKNERVELEMKILRYRKLARQMATDPNTAQHIKELIADLEREPRENNVASSSPCSLNNRARYLALPTG